MPSPLLHKVRVALEALSVVGDVFVSKRTPSASGGPAWWVTFLNNAGNLPLLTVDSSAMWGGVTISVDEEVRGTSKPVTGSFEIGTSEEPGAKVMLPYYVSAVEVMTPYRMS